MRRLRWLRRMILAVVPALSAILVMAPPASAATHQNANIYAYWKFNGAGFWNVDQYVVVRTKAIASYWALHWTWSGSSSGGYMGLQTNGSRFDGTTGDTAIFSQPAANLIKDGVYQYGSTYSGSAKGSCTDGKVAVVDWGWTKAARAVLGG